MYGGRSGERPSEVLKIGPSTFIVEKLPDRPYGPTGSIEFSEFIDDIANDVTITARETLNCGEPRRVEYEVKALMRVEEFCYLTPIDLTTEERWCASFGKAPIRISGDNRLAFSRGHVINRVMDSIFNCEMYISPNDESKLFLYPPGVGIANSNVYQRTFAIMAVFRVGQVLGVTE